MNCNIEVAKTFVYAIANNICPACGKPIMDEKGFKSYSGLKTVLESVGVPEIDKTICAILASFDLLPKDNAVVGTEPKPIDTVELVQTKVEVSSDLAPKNDAETARNKDILQKMRDEVLQEALHEKYGDEIEFTDDNISMHEMVSRGVQEAKREKILSGTGGVFRRSE
jgi:hypothetical protein